MAFGGCGGPAPVVASLYQTLNRFINCGPTLRTKTLPQPLVLEGLEIRVYRDKKLHLSFGTGEDERRDQSIRTSSCNITAGHISSFLHTLGCNGLLGNVCSYFSVSTVNNGCNGLNGRGCPEGPECTHSKWDENEKERTNLVVRKDVHSTWAGIPPVIPERWARYGFDWGNSRGYKAARKEWEARNPMSEEVIRQAMEK
jgi:hypothetical protein